MYHPTINDLLLYLLAFDALYEPSKVKNHKIVFLNINPFFADINRNKINKSY